MKTTNLNGNLFKFTLTLLTGSALLLAQSIHAAPPVKKATPAADQKISTYQQLDSLCNGFAQAPVESFEGSCLGIVASKTSGIKMPRYAVQSKTDQTIYISDMGGWAYGNGTIWAMKIKTDGTGKKFTELTNLFPKNKLTMPNGLLLDPEGRLYVGTPTGIYRFSPKNQNQSFNLDPALELIEDGFMQSVFRKTEYANAQAYNTTPKATKSRHPLVQLAANKDFTEIYLNVGAPSDNCTQGVKTKNDQGLCIQSESSLINAGIWQINLSNDTNRKKINTEGLARGLRNSMGLAIHPETQKLFQAENSMDLTDVNLPYEEINLIEKNQHYGWPYCHSNGQVNEAFKNVVTSNDCLHKYKNPIINMPAHAAPLSLLFYSGKMFENLKDHLLVSWHGYREVGQKVVAYDINSNAEVVSDKPAFLIRNWTAKKSVRPLGAPTGLTELEDGSILVMDDKNATILLLSEGQSYSENTADENHIEKANIPEKQLLAMKALMPTLKNKCSACHAEFNHENVTDLIHALDARDLYDIDSPLNSKMFQKIKKTEMPLGQPLSKPEYDQVMKLIQQFPIK